MSVKTDKIPFENILKKILIKENFNENATINFESGSNKGDGYAASHNSITLEDDAKKLNIFVKASSNTLKENDILNMAYGTECDFYEYVAPVLLQFEKGKNVKTPFNNLPICYGVDKNDRFAIALENLRSKGFTLHDRKEALNEKYLLLMIEAFAKFHAISFAMKDQNEELYKEICAKIPNAFGFIFKEMNLFKCMLDMVEEVVNRIDDKEFKDKCKSLQGRLSEFLDEISSPPVCRSVIVQGDCWCNNLMFLYEDKTNNPIDIKILDFQIARDTSPIFDLSYLFYSSAEKKDLDKLDYYLNYYYEHLSEKMRELGSDPELVYSFSAFKEDWKRFSLFGLAMSPMVFKARLFEDDEVLVSEDMRDFGREMTDVKIKKDKEYFEKVTSLMKHFIDCYENE